MVRLQPGEIADERLVRVPIPRALREMSGVLRWWVEPKVNPSTQVLLSELPLDVGAQAGAKAEREFQFRGQV